MKCEETVREKLFAISFLISPFLSLSKTEGISSWFMNCQGVSHANMAWSFLVCFQPSSFSAQPPASTFWRVGTPNICWFCTVFCHVAHHDGSQLKRAHGQQERLVSHCIANSQRPLVCETAFTIESTISVSNWSTQMPCRRTVEEDKTFNSL